MVDINVNAPDPCPEAHGRSALHWACAHNHLEAVRFLVEETSTILVDCRGAGP